MGRITEFVEKLFENVPESEQAAQVKEEITYNLEEKVADLMEEGKSEEDAVNKAIIEFGDMDEIIAELEVAKPNTKKRRALAKVNLGLSIWGSALLIILFIVVNVMYSPDVLWCIFPIFAVLWWPLSMFYFWYRRKAEDK
ncbi:permease prefix domain 1-containing protein [Listeria booriae]|uniref:2TM domain-containing protein n=1 Tax=Listeria booriae TaxID=1552123 RepID=A0A7X0XFH5_9LIST|nr:permease prefix domain 1-containing protein [Listeria booriae]MBC1493092.1 hypothetical protein [Listeria booriae]MBC1503354.1 hypothetical protein [Listeria booriae]